MIAVNTLSSPVGSIASTVLAWTGRGGRIRVQTPGGPHMINGVPSIIYSTDVESYRAFLRDGVG